MATRIRLKRYGRRNRPSFRIVIVDSRAKRDGATIEELGWYDPIQKENNFSLKVDRIIHWLEQGAQPSVTVKNLMRKSGLLYRWHMIRQGMDEKRIDQELQKWVFDREAREREKSEIEIKEAGDEDKVKVQVGDKSTEIEATPKGQTETVEKEVDISEEPELAVVSEETTAPSEEREEEEQIKGEEEEKSEKEKEIDESGKSEDAKKKPKVKSKTTRKKSSKKIDQAKEKKSESTDKSD